MHPASKVRVRVVEDPSRLVGDHRNPEKIHIYVCIYHKRGTGRRDQEQVHGGWGGMSRVRVRSGLDALSGGSHGYPRFDMASSFVLLFIWTIIII